MDKVLRYENIIQAFSRTNRLFGPEKPFGTIRYYRMPHTMEQNIKKAVKEYSGDKPTVLFVDKLAGNLNKLNDLFADITDLFQNAGVRNFEKLPADVSTKAKFASIFREFNNVLEAAKIQGFEWETTVYNCMDSNTDKKTTIKMNFDQTAYYTLIQRYKELATEGPDNPSVGEEPYDIDGYLTEIDTGLIDANYMNTQFDKYLSLLHKQGVTEEELEQSLNELHKTFASLSQEEQKYANIFIHDVQRGDVKPEEGMTIRETITEYQYKAKKDQIHEFASTFGIDEDMLRKMMERNITENNINEFGVFDKLKDTVDKKRARKFFETTEGIKLVPPLVNIKMDSLLRRFILSGGFDLTKE